MSDLSGSGELDEELEEQIGDSGGGDEFEDRLDIKPPQLTSAATADRVKLRHEERDRRRRRKHEYRETRRSRRDRHEEREVRTSGSGRHRRHRRDRSRESSRQHHKSNRGASRELPQPPPADDNGGGDPRYQSRARQRSDGAERHSRHDLTASNYPVPGDLRQRIQQQQQQQYMVGEDEAYREQRHRRPASGHGSLMLSVVADQQDRSRHDDSAAGWRREVREEVVPLEVQRRRERCLQAVRQSEYQRDVSRRELEARRIRRDQEREIRRRREHHEREELEHSEERSPSSERKRRRLEPQSQQTDMFAAESECEEEALEEEEERLSADQAEENGCDDEADQQSIGQEAGESDKSSEESSSDQNDEEQTEESSSSSSSSSAEGDDERDRVENGSEGKRSSSRARESAEDEDSRLVEGRRRWRTDSRSPSPEANNLRSRSPTPVEHEPEYDDAKLRSLTPPSSPELEQRLPPYLPAVLGCRNVVEFNCLNRIEEGTYGVVYRAEDKRTKEIVALKRLKMENEKEGFPITSLREINTLLKAQHENIVTVREIVVGSNMDKIYIVMDYVEHDLKSLMQTMKEKKQTFVSGEVKCLMVQLMRAVRHLHDNWILHRDLKTSNLLLSHRGILKVGDFGLAREYGSPLQNYTAVVVTLWYRAPELLLGSRLYTCPIDVWSAGCIFAELLRMEPLFPGKSEVDEINKIFKELGTPNETIWPGYSKLPAVSKMTFADYPYNQLANKFGTVLTETGLRLLNQLLTYDPDRRITADDALSHPYFAEHPRPIDPSMFPTWPAKSEMSHRKSGNSPKPPSGRKNIGDEDVRFQLAPGAVAGGGFSLKF